MPATAPVMTARWTGRRSGSAGRRSVVIVVIVVALVIGGRRCRGGALSGRGHRASGDGQLAIEPGETGLRRGQPVAEGIGGRRVVRELVARGLERIGELRRPG